MKQEKFQNSKIISTELNNYTQNNNAIKNIVFYRKSSIKNKKTSFYQCKNENNCSNIMARKNNYISGYKNKKKLYDYTNEETKHSSAKTKSIVYSKNKYSIESQNDDSTHEKNNVDKTSISPFYLYLNDSYKENNENNNDNGNNEKNHLNKNSKCLKNIINTTSINNYDNNKNKNLTVDTCYQKHRFFVNNNYGQNEKNKNDFILINANNYNYDNMNSIINVKSRKNRTIKNIEKKGINFTFKNIINNDKESSDINKNIEKHSSDKNKCIKYNNSSNNLINNNHHNNKMKLKKHNSVKNNMFTYEVKAKNLNQRNSDLNIETSYNNKYNIYHNFNFNNFSNNNKIIEKNFKKNLDINKTNENNNNVENESNNNLNKGKIVKFKYNGTEFFFHPEHNKTQNAFHKTNKNNNNNTVMIKREDLIKSAKIIQKWWKQTMLIKLLITKNKMKFCINIIRNIKIRNYFLIK